MGANLPEICTLHIPIINGIRAISLFKNIEDEFHLILDCTILTSLWTQIEPLLRKIYPAPVTRQEKVKKDVTEKLSSETNKLIKSDCEQNNCYSVKRQLTVDS